MSVLNRSAGDAARFSNKERTRALKRIIRRDAIAKALERCGKGTRHCRRAPRRLMVWFVIAMGLYTLDSYCQVFRWLRPYRADEKTPGRSTLCEARKSLGAAPLRRLAETVIRLQARPDASHAFYAGLRLTAIDGFTVNVADSEANDRAFGRPRNGRSAGAFPQARVVSLCEVGTHVLYKSQIKPYRCGEPTMVRSLLRFLTRNMLLLWDRNFLSYDLVRAVRGRGTHLLARAKTNLIFQPIEHLCDGSYLADMYPSAQDRRKGTRGLTVRIVEYAFDDPHRPGTGERHRLLTSLLNHENHPAETLVELYHERWEEELAIDELKTHQREKRVLRSETPAGVVQELYGLLLGHYVVRKLMCEAADLAGVAPRALSFTNTLKILRCRLPEAPNGDRGLAGWYRNLIAEIAEQRLEPRRNRINPRVVKITQSKWPKKRPEHRKFPQPTKPVRHSIVMLD